MKLSPCSPVETRRVPQPAPAGPTGLTLACDLARRGINLRIIDKSRAGSASQVKDYLRKCARK